VKGLTTEDTEGTEGIALRDWFAGQALSGLLASGDFTFPGGYVVTPEGNPEFSAPGAAWALAKQMMKTHNALIACEHAEKKKAKKGGGK